MSKLEVVDARRLKPPVAVGLVALPLHSMDGANFVDPLSSSPYRPDVVRIEILRIWSVTFHDSMVEVLADSFTCELVETGWASAIRMAIGELPAVGRQNPVAHQAARA